MGVLWGLSMPLMQIAVSEGYRHFGLIFWQLVITVMFFGVVQGVRRKPLRFSRPALRVYTVVALIGSILPAAALYESARHLPAGLLSILIAFVPLLTYPLAIALKIDDYDQRRLIGLLLGFLGVLMILLPSSSLPDASKIIFVPLALLAACFYAMEANYVSKWGTANLDPIEVLLGASIFGALFALVLSLSTGQFIDPRTEWNGPEYALVLMAVVSGAAFAMYVWLLGRAGAVFAAQVGYLITGFGVAWSIVILGESYSLWVWGAMAVVLCGVFLVQPREKAGERAQT